MSARRRNINASIAGAAAFCWLVFGAMGPVPAEAAAESPQWTVSVVSGPTDFAPEDHSGEDIYTVRVTNTGGAQSNDGIVTIADRLPGGLVSPAGAKGVELLSDDALSCAALTCTFSGVVPVGDTLTVTIPVYVEPGAGPLETDVATVSGGGAAEASASTTTTISATAAGFGMIPGSFSIVPSSTQAGGHADLTTSFYLDSEGGRGDSGTDGHIRTVVIDLPSGFAGDPNAMPTCNERQLLGTSDVAECPVASQVGTLSLPLYLYAGKPPLPVTEPVYNMEAAPGMVAEFGFNYSGVIVQNFGVVLRPDDSGLEVRTPNIQGSAEIEGASLTVWGIPAAAVHDPLRGAVCIRYVCEGGGQSAGVIPQPFLSNPTACTEGTLEATIAFDSWEQPVQGPPAPTNIGPFTGCEGLEFGPALTVEPTTDSASAPTGLNVGVSIPQSYGNPVAAATANLMGAVVTLPEGMTVNPSAGAGLGSCTPAQYAAETLDSLSGEGCPSDSSLGTVTIDTPVLKETATGTVYLATPYDNPFPEEGHPGGSLLAMYIVARIPQRGVIVRVAGRVTPNPVTGQLVTTFENDPQLPFNEFKLSFRQGQTSPLVTPPVCGEYIAEGEFFSWAKPAFGMNIFSPPFDITQGVGGGECPSGGVPPLNPRIVTAGTLSNAAGTYSPFYLRIDRNDGEQEITHFSTILPPGLSGNLTGIPFCPEADIEAARTVSGTEELEHPSCPAASEVGHTLVGAGVGGVLAYTPGKVFLAGPYHGAPLSMVSITSATVGPFDLGTVVIRFALRINPSTAQVEVSSAGSDPIPHIIRGIVVHVRDIRVYVNRPNFTINPTNCNPMTIAATITGAGADPTNPADGVPVAVSERFQAADCANLAFKPSFKVSTSGRTSRARGASLTAKLSYPHTPLGTEANIAKVAVDLPKQLPSRLQTLQKACPAATFEANPAACPVASDVGHARAITPIVPVPLEGPAYFVSHGGEAFPSLIVVLQGYGLTVDLVGTTFINKHGITSSTFNTVPDVPVGSFELTLPEGPNSALAAPHNLCAAKKLEMPTAFLAQNGATIHESTTIKVTGCPKKRAARHRARRKAK